MIDRIWERWAEKMAPLIQRAAAMTEKGLDPACEGCRTAFQTNGKFWSGHTCERGKANQAQLVARLAETLRKPRRPKGGVRKRSW